MREPKFSVKKPARPWDHPLHDPWCAAEERDAGNDELADEMDAAWVRALEARGEVSRLAPEMAEAILAYDRVARGDYDKESDEATMDAMGAVDRLMPAVAEKLRKIGA